MMLVPLRNDAVKFQVPLLAPAPAQRAAVAHKVLEPDQAPNGPTSVSIHANAVP